MLLPVNLMLLLKFPVFMRESSTAFSAS